MLKKQTKRKSKLLKNRGYAGDAILYIVILVGLVILGMQLIGGIPTAIPKLSNLATVTLIPKNPGAPKNELQLQTFTGITGLPTPTLTPTPPPPAQTGGGASGQPPPTDNVQGWKLIFEDDFTKDAPVGSWGSECDSQKIVYTGATGTKWVSYPNCFKDTYQSRPYRADQVLSVHDGVLDFYLHPVDGQPAGANPSPVITGTSQYQTYGRYVARFKVDPGLSEYYAAWLLWPENDGDGSCAESDFPEGSLTDTISGFAHHCGGQDEINGNGTQFTAWHTYTQEWMPGVRKYYVDDKLIGTSTNQIWSGPERWQLQTETNGNGAHTGHLLLDWVAVYSYTP